MHCPVQKIRLIAWVDLVLSVKGEVAKFGCPVGSMCQELDKERIPVAKKADGILANQLKWVIKQFQNMGRKNADELGLQFVSSLHGIAVVGNALKSPKAIKNELERLKAWVDMV